MDRLKKMSVLSPLCLYRHDLFHIEKILRRHIPDAGSDLNITPIEHGHPISGTPFHSFDALFQVERLPQKLDEITIEARETSADRELVHDAKIFIGKRICYLRVISKEDQEWVDTVFDELNTFLKSRKVWFSFLARAMQPITNSSIVISILLTLLATLTGHYHDLIFPIAIVSCAVTLLILNLNGVVYSIGRINLFHHLEDKRPDYERYVIWVYFAIVFSCIIGAIIGTWEAITAA